MIEFYVTVAADQITPKHWPYVPGDVAYMLPASSWARFPSADRRIKDVALPTHITHTAADCGGFVATRVWGDYRYTPDDYACWLGTFEPQWAATMDYCCEDEIIAGRQGLVADRQRRTAAMAEHFWTHYRSAPWAWVPTIQGWLLDDYVRHARELRGLIYEMRDWYDGHPGFRVGIGTLCARASTQMIHDVVGAVAVELPGVPLHLWGVKLRVLQSRKELQGVVSVDSAAWYASGLKRTGHEANEERQALGMSQREHAFKVALPRYLDKVHNALRQPHQLSLF